MDYDALTRGLARVNIKASNGPKAYNGIEKRLFPSKEGTAQDVMKASYEEWGVNIPEQAVRGADPDRVNYKTPFNEKYIEGAYHFIEQKINLADAQNRLFDEPMESAWSVEQRELHLLAKIRDRMHRDFIFARQGILSDALFTGKFTTKNGGEQSFPVIAKNLSLAGAGLSTNPVSVLSKAVMPIVKKGHIIDTLILNPEDAITLMAATGTGTWSDILDKKHIVAGMDTKALGEDGFSYIGTIPSVGSGLIKVLAYFGTKNGSDFFIPQGKAILCGEPVGVMGYCGVLSVANGVQAQVAAEESFTVYGKERGALIDTFIQGQIAPCPIVYGVESYGILTGIN